MAEDIVTTKDGRALPLVLRGVTNTLPADVSASLIATMERGYQSFNHLLDSATGKTISIVGAGPSLKWTYKDLAGDVMACNSAHDFLIEHGVIPKYAMIWDANPVIARFVTKPHRDVTYLIASRCHPDVFKALEGHKVIVWHAMGDDGLEEILVKYQRNEPWIAGGTAGATRGVYVAAVMGYRTIHFFGIDSCYEDEETHVSGSVIDQKRMRLKVCGKWFVVAPWMAMQAGDFKFFIPKLQERGVKIVVHGTGLIPYISTFLKCETPDIKVPLTEKIRRQVHAVIILFIMLKNSPQLLGGSHAG